MIRKYVFQVFVLHLWGFYKYTLACKTCLLIEITCYYGGVYCLYTIIFYCEFCTVCCEQSVINFLTMDRRRIIQPSPNQLKNAKPGDFHHQVTFVPCLRQSQLPLRTWWRPIPKLA